MDGQPFNFRVMNIALSMETQMEFLEVMQRIGERATTKDWKKREAKLLDSATQLDERKLLLAQLALTDNVEVMRALERYAETCPADIKDFAQMAAYQSKLFLEASILGQNQVVVASGLGGDGDKMRFFVALMSLKRKPLSATQQQVVQKEVAYQLRQTSVVVESITFEGCYAKILALIPMRTNIRRIFEQCIEACNELGEFLEKNMVISTVKVMSADELNQMIAEKG